MKKKQSKKVCGHREPLRELTVSPDLPKTNSASPAGCGIASLA